MENDLDATLIVEERVKAWLHEKLKPLGIPVLNRTENKMGSTIPPRPFLQMLAFPSPPNDKLREAFARHEREVEMR